MESKLIAAATEGSLAASVPAANEPTITSQPQHSWAISVEVNWPEFMARQDPVWDRLPADYYEGPFVGNGLLGAILFADDQQPNTLRFEIGRTDVYDHRNASDQGTDPYFHKSSAMYGVGRLPIGQLLLTPVGTIEKISLRTDLWNAEIRGEIATTAGVLQLRCYVPSGESLVVVDLKSVGREKDAKCTFRPEQGNHPRRTVAPKRDENTVYEPNPPFVVEKRGDIEVVTQPLLAGDDYATAWIDQAHSDDSRTIFVTVANRWAKGLQQSKGSGDDAVATIKAAISLDRASVEGAHRTWWHKFYPASFLSIPDARAESFYWIQLYKLASATREDRPAMDLMGPWFKKSVWAAYWVNLNVQLAYCTAGITNHLELAEPLYRLIERRTDELIKNVPEPYRNDCAALGNPVGYDTLKAGVMLKNDPKVRLNLIALPWLMQMFYTHNRMTMDDTRLRENIYPLMKRTFQVYLRVATSGTDGKYRIPYAFSNEYGTAEETSMNIALAQWGFRTLIQCADRLKIQDPMLPKWKEFLEKMADYNIDANGIMIGKDTPFSKPHRHYSHLFGIFPLYTLNIDHDPKSIRLMKTSIQHFADLDGDNCMFKFTGASSLWAALGDGENAAKWLARSLEILPRHVPTVGPNTLYSEEGWPTIESPIASSRCILDMLIQSWGGTIRVFPACPAAWKDAVFHDLRTEGGFLVSAARKNGKTEWVRIKSLAGEPGRVQIDGKIKDFELAAGEELVLGNGDGVVAPLPVEPALQNSWGAHGMQ